MLAAAIKRYPVVRVLIDLRVTVACLSLLFVLTFLGTMHQIDNGIYSAQKKYFESFFTLAAGFVPLPGAQLVLWVLCVNLAAATVYRFAYRARRIGILIIHGGLFALFFGMFFTQYFAQESFLSLLEGEGGNVTTDYFDWEVAVWDPAGETRRVAAVDAAELADGNTVRIDRYGVELRPQRYFAHAQAFSRSGGAPSPWINGSGIDSLAEARVSPDPQENFPGVLLTVAHRDGSAEVLLYGADVAPASVPVAGGRLAVALRRKHYVMPLVVTLDDFRAEFHPNSDTPRSFESDVILSTPQFTRSARISMNHPLRHAGYTFYQASYAIDATGRETSTLAVVHNRSRVVPYVGTLVVGLGLAVHFVQTLVLRRRRRPAPRAGSPDGGIHA
ncbi:MAG: cytochrome c biogenesis protein ResB [Spirochaetaceae bacterium]|nr:cytochrome c biogenesis protein ResB [Spirochaetaceae bacterium]